MLTLSPEQYLLDIQSMFEDDHSNQSLQECSAAQLQVAFCGFKSSLRCYLSSNSLSGYDARRHFLRVSRRFKRRLRAGAVNCKVRHSCASMALASARVPENDYFQKRLSISKIAFNQPSSTTLATLSVHMHAADYVNQ
ncbi:hypothetical protein BCR33DRAFT_823249 [Rhizoclosmatium globosum]|uniref:Uncharacterized protein n=1 Tax=Rhizoclosmatium globosum TaxID=329046 RepID=A0A1Y2C5I8_9FUNG|nr:hypothetical protein BCR33DRAFT_823249 [Rhizoclosmatium globosum]|eukprot:ORY42299.1 hypothetical protein BCR33DRAFT_823249 [Rhizoclosmatium globosum]